MCMYVYLYISLYTYIYIYIYVANPRVGRGLVGPAVGHQRHVAVAGHALSI